MIGLDTINLTTPASSAHIRPSFAEFLSDPDNRNGDIKQSISPEKNLFLYEDTRGALVAGKSALWKGDGFTLQVLPSGDCPNISLLFSAAALTGDNSTPMDAEVLRATVEHIEAQLREVGIEADWQDAKPARSDAALNAPMNHKIPAYLDAWRGAAFRYGVTPEFPKETSFRLTLSTSDKWLAQWEFYDKGLERDKKAAKGRAKASCAPSKLARFELRLRGEAVGRALGEARPKLRDLMAPGAFEKLARAHRNSARNELLSMFKDTSAALSKDELLSARLASLAEAKAQGATRAKFNAAMSQIAPLAIYGFDGACEFWEKSFAAPLPSDSEKERESKKRALRHFRRSLREEANFIQASSPVTSDATRQELVAELREKLLAES